jgi:hypothetical protein
MRWRIYLHCLAATQRLCNGHAAAMQRPGTHPLPVTAPLPTSGAQTRLARLIASGRWPPPPADFAGFARAGATPGPPPREPPREASQEKLV